MMKAIILAAGRGSRMGSMTEDKPKCLLEIKGKTLLATQIETIHNGGVTEIGVVTGYKRELIMQHHDLHEFNNPDWNDTNMVHSLSMADEWLSKQSCIVSYGDLFYDSSAIVALIKSQDQLAMMFDRDWLSLWSRRFPDPLSDAETFIIDKNFFVQEIGAKPLSLAQIQGQYMGILRFNPESWNLFKSLYSALEDTARNKIDMTSMLQLIIKSGKLPIKGINYEGVWGEIDSQDDIQIYRDV